MTLELKFDRASKFYEPGVFHLINSYKGKSDRHSHFQRLLKCGLTRRNAVGS